MAGGSQRRAGERPRKAAPGAHPRLPGAVAKAGEPAVIPVVADDPGPLVPAGWYPDPGGGSEKRYWDGEAWTKP